MVAAVAGRVGIGGCPVWVVCIAVEMSGRVTARSCGVGCVSRILFVSKVKCWLVLPTSAIMDVVVRGPSSELLIGAVSTMD
jgi:hypothetical protein